MQHATQVTLARALLRHLEAGTTALAEDVMRSRADVLRTPGGSSASGR